MALKLSDLITQCGDDVQFQNLDQCAKSLDYHHKKGTTITFGTEMNVHAPQGTEKLGLVVWLDRSKVAEIVNASKAGA
jgi:hypothetical protein